MTSRERHKAALLLRSKVLQSVKDSLSNKLFHGAEKKTIIEKAFISPKGLENILKLKTLKTRKSVFLN